MHRNKTDNFLQVIENNKGIIYKIANSYSKSDEDRKDLVQETILQLWKSYDNYDVTFRHSTWIYRISLNVAISFYRKESSRKRMSNPLVTEIFDFPDNNLSDEQQSNLSFLNQLISELDDLNKALILLYLEEKSYQEISEIIGISETNVATKINRIKNKLKRKFTQLKTQ